MEFAVHVNGEAPGQGFWVCAVDAAGGRFLLAGEKGVFRWVPIANCTFMRGTTPEMPRPVVLVQPAQPKQGLAIPQLHVGNGRS